VIGGVITSTVLTLIVIPTVYEILDEVAGEIGAKFFGKRAVDTNRCRIRATD